MTAPEWPGSPLARPGLGIPDGGWLDELRAQLFERRTILVRGVLDDATANQAAAELMTLDATGDTRITMHVDVAGGPLHASLAVMDVIDLVGVPVHVLCTGRVEGAAVGVVAVAAHRACAPHVQFRLVDPPATISGSASELGRWAEHELIHLHRFHDRVAAASRRGVSEVAEDFGVGRFLDADEALAYGLIDEIARPRGTVYPLPGRTVGFRSDGGR